MHAGPLASFAADATLQVFFNPFRFIAGGSFCSQHSGETSGVVNRKHDFRMREGVCV